MTKSLPMMIVLLASLLAPRVVEKDDTEVLKPAATEYDPSSRPELDKTSSRIVDLTNELRHEKKLAKLKISPELSKTAASFAGYMAGTSRYGHRADGKRAEERVEKQGYAPCIVGENIAYAFRATGFTTDELETKLFEGWRDSPEHLNNMLDPDVTETGVAVQVGESGYFFAVQLFGRPKSMAVQFKLANESDETFEYVIGDDALKLSPGELRAHRVCRAQDLRFSWRQGENRPQTVQASDGDLFAITKHDGAVHVRKK